MSETDYVMLTLAIVPKIQRLARRYRAHLREDLTQDAIERVWIKRRQWDPSRAPWAAFAISQAKTAIYLSLRSRRFQERTFETDEGKEHLPYAAIEARRVVRALVAKASLTPRESRAVDEFLASGKWSCRMAGSRAIAALREVAHD